MRKQNSTITHFERSKTPRRYRLRKHRHAKAPRRYIIALTVCSGGAGLAALGAAYVSQLQPGSYGAFALTAVIMCCIAIVAAARGAVPLQIAARNSVAVRMLVRFSLGLIGLLGLAVMLIVVAAGMPMWPLVTIAGSLVVLLVTGIFKPEVILQWFDQMNHPAQRRREPRLTRAGWLVTAIAIAAMLGLGIPIIMRLLQGPRPALWPSLFLALPVLLLGAVIFLAGFRIAHGLHIPLWQADRTRQ